MKTCEKCGVQLKGKGNNCPLCQNELIGSNEGEEAVFPLNDQRQKETHMVIKVINFMMLCVGIMSVFFNVLYPVEIWWSLIVVLTLIGVRVSLFIAIAKHKNILKYLWNQSLVIIAFAIVIDYISGNHGWAITFVLPIIFTLAMIIMYLISKILHLQVGDYMIYLLLDAVFGIIPILFLLLQSVTTAIPSLICIMVSIISVIALISFEGPSMYSELKRRLHV
ncbi:hypothetical protein CS063_01750 [Sporanaerobium hydrogeniformans]|uniref:Uncharacterized protein n=1 Tax=Sporanaerobium hydrogeniformans TaxID=3072179 RepID=A0AC61DFY2_9FIRM|nr:DUF6320 domain-containing protein [Sporanaerobium hydrogeniformans]PHV72225.1 hypothetical protein CS063_01750 [Sporanaerobium hydrogeniformans]